MFIASGFVCFVVESNTTLTRKLSSMPSTVRPQEQSGSLARDITVPRFSDQDSWSTSNIPVAFHQLFTLRELTVHALFTVAPTFHTHTLLCVEMWCLFAGGTSVTHNTFFRSTVVIQARHRKSFDNNAPHDGKWEIYSSTDPQTCGVEWRDPNEQ